MGIIHPEIRRRILYEEYLAAEKEIMRACAAAIAAKKQEIDDIKLKAKEARKELKATHEENLRRSGLE